ncbi:methyl-accepting chemotaxis protein [Thiohalorhabdus sp. Cl-TMA]|uniref:Methyl-accepting chemotaxis protein n=1 Tax=Thiohalorhabdus methylotrophus TaxID=3242694 RepID=A0ABV4TW74_9GAMM
MGVLQQSGGTASQELPTSRENADRAARELNTLFREGLPYFDTGYLKEPIHQLRQAFQRRSEVRHWVDNGRHPEKVFAFYSDLNANALHILRQVAGRIDEAALARQLRSLYGVIGLQEQAAKARGKLTEAFAAGETTPSQFLAIRGFARAQDRYRETFSLNATSGQRDFLERNLQADAVERVRQIREDFLNTSKEVGSGPEADAWFRLASQRIKRIQEVADHVASELAAQADRRVAAAQLALWGYSGFAGLIVLATIGLVAAVGRSIVRPLQDAAGMTQRITQSERWDLSLRIEANGRDEVAQLGQAFNTFLDALQEVVATLDDKTHDLTRGRSNLTAGAEAIAGGANEAREQVQQMTTSAEEVNGVVQEVAGNITGVSESATETAQTTRQGKQAVDEAANKIRALREASGRADEILNSIQTVAKKTDLLALNAAIEAANAGDQGKGFAVVADEVRQLAEQTRQATGQVGNIVGEVQGHSKESEEAMNQVLERMDAILERVSEIDRSADQIAASAEELAATMGETTDNMQVISNHTDQVADQVAAIQGTATEIGALADELQAVTTRFRPKEGPQPAHS